MLSGVQNILLIISITSYVAFADISSRILGGDDAKPGQFPYQISLQMNKNHYCGGSILNERYIITAGHCVHRHRPSTLKVVVGTHNLKNLKPDNVYNVEKIILHEKYITGFKHDIALIKVKKNMKFNKKVRPIKIGEQLVPKEKYAFASGWGRTSWTGRETDILKFVELKTIDNKKCRLFSPVAIFDSHLCTFTRKGEGVFYGDSGGPLVIGDNLVGIASFITKVPDVFTRVSSYADWIKNHIEKDVEDDAKSSEISNESNDY